MENKLFVTKWERAWGGINLEDGIYRYKLPHVKQLSSDDLLYSTGNNIHYLVITHNGK